MPLFDTQCGGCGNIKEEIVTNCPNNFKKTIYCSFCKGMILHDILPPLTAMHPDNMWFNGNTGLGNFSSKKQYKDYIRNNNLELATRDNYESVQKKSKTRIKDAMEKSTKSIEKFIEKELSGVEISPDGNTVKEKNKYNKVRE